MRLIHYSKEPLTAILPANPETVRFGKPPGLWVSAEETGQDDDNDWGWRKWCEAENFCLDRLTHATEIILKPQPKPLWIQSEATLRLFGTEFGQPMFGDGGYYDIGPGTVTSRYEMINWTKVATKWPALIVAPYRYECRLDMDCMWYYLWDCASGVIWDTSIIADLKPAPEFARPVEAA